MTDPHTGGPASVRIRRTDIEPTLTPDEEQAVEAVSDTPVSELSDTDLTLHRRAYNRKLDRGYKKLQLMRELAMGEKTLRQLGAEYDVVHTSILYFKKKHAEEIQEIRDNLADEFSGLWAAKKQNRIAVYQTMIEEVLESGITDASLLRVGQTALRGIADELGEIPNRLDIKSDNTTKVTYEVVGVNVDDLQ